MTKINFTPSFQGRMVLIGNDTTIDSDLIETVRRDQRGVANKATLYIAPNSYGLPSEFELHLGDYNKPATVVENYEKLNDKISEAKTTSGGVIDLTK